MKNKKVTIALLSVGIVVGIGTTVYTVMSSDEDETKKEQTVHVDSQKKQSENKKKEDIKINPLKEGVSNDGKKEKMDNSAIITNEQKIRNLNRAFKFSEVVSLLTPIQEKYELDGDAQVLKDLFYDSSLLSNLITDETPTSASGATGDGIINIITGMRDPENALIGALTLDVSERDKVILNGDSLSPILNEKKISIYSKEVETGDILNNVLILYPDTKTLHKLSISIDGNGMNGYIIEYPDGSMRVHSIKDPTGKSKELTVSQWKKINANIKNGRPVMDGTQKEVTPAQPAREEPKKVESQNAESARNEEKAKAKAEAEVNEKALAMAETMKQEQAEADAKKAKVKADKEAEIKAKEEAKKKAEVKAKAEIKAEPAVTDSKEPK